MWTSGADELDFVIPHQANSRIIDAVRKRADRSLNSQPPFSRLAASVAQFSNGGHDTQHSCFLSFNEANGGYPCGFVIIIHL